MIFSSNGRIYYASESVSSLLGYLPSELTNSSIYEITYEEDQSLLYNILLNPSPVLDHHQIKEEHQVSFTCHIKRGSLDLQEEPTYERVRFVGYFRSNSDIESLLPSNRYSSSTSDSKVIFVGTGRLLTPHLIQYMSLVDSTKLEFTSRHSLEWKFLFLDHRAPPIIGYLPFEVLGTSGYDYYHVDDLDKVVSCHESLMKKGEGTSCHYRFLTKGQQWIWLQTRFYIDYNQWNSKPEFIVCTHKVVSYTEVLKQLKKLKDGPNQETTESITAAVITPTATKQTRSSWSPKSSRTKITSQNIYRGTEADTASLSVSPQSLRQSVSTTQSPKSKIIQNTVKSGPGLNGQRLGLNGQGTIVNGQVPPSRREPGACGQGPESNEQNLGSGGQGLVSSVQGLGSSGQGSRSNGLGPELSGQRPGPSGQISRPRRQLAIELGPDEVCNNYIEPNYTESIISAVPATNFLSPAPPVTVTLPSTMVVNPQSITAISQNQMQSELQRKHEELQQLIVHQQEELRRVSEQLLIARYGILSPLINTNLPQYNGAAGIGSVGSVSVTGACQGNEERTEPTSVNDVSINILPVPVSIPVPVSVPVPILPIPTFPHSPTVIPVAPIVIPAQVTDNSATVPFISQQRLLQEPRRHEGIQHSQQAQGQGLIDGEMINYSIGQQDIIYNNAEARNTHRSMINQ